MRISMRPAPLLAGVLEMVERFVRNPSEDNRRAAEALGHKVGFDTIGGCLAMAAFFSDGSISGPGLPCVPPRPFLTGRLVSVVVYLAAVQKDPSAYLEELGRSIALGLDMLEGPDPWLEAITVRTVARAPVPALSLTQEALLAGCIG
jgi:hypothetical protein